MCAICHMPGRQTDILLPQGHKRERVIAHMKLKLSCRSSETPAVWSQLTWKNPEAHQRLTQRWSKEARCAVSVASLTFHNLIMCNKVKRLIFWRVTVKTCYCYCQRHYCMCQNLTLGLHSLCCVKSSRVKNTLKRMGYFFICSLCCCVWCSEFR